ncbi:MAG: hypothetical protein K6G65_07670 [Lachnospiraceae bacterium]|nr:hypothetical protein [Lachnospiraceae bacterium]
MKNKIKQMGMYTVVAVLAVIIALSSGFLVKNADAQKKAKGAEAAYEMLEVKENVKSFKKTTISWKKKKVDEYVIYKIKAGKKPKKVAKIPGKRTSYTVKTSKDKNYGFKIEGRKYKKGTKKLIYHCVGEAYFYSGVTTLEWNRSMVSEPKYFEKSTEMIRMSLMDYNTGMKPDGYVIYRKVSGEETFEKYKTIKKNKKGKLKYTWEDNNVQAHQTYVYMAQSYKKIGKKYYYGVCCDGYTCSAVRKSAKFSITGEAEGKEPILKLKGVKDNGKTILDGAFFNIGYFSKNNKKERYVLKEISIDGTNWFTAEEVGDLEKKLIIEGNESFWLKFNKEKNSPEYSKYEGGTIEYDGDPFVLTIDPYMGTVKTVLPDMYW